MRHFTGVGMSPAEIRRRLAVTALLAVPVLAIAGCASSEPSADPSSSSSSSTISAVAVTLSNDSGSDTCALDIDSVPAGPVTFTVTNESAAGITEVELLKDQRILNEKENLAPGLDPVSFTTTLDGGDYEVYCPGADEDHIAFTVTGDAAAQPTGSTQTILADGAADYATYVIDQVALLVEATNTLDAAVQSGDVEAAQQAYGAARPFYERAESSIEGFVLDGFDAEDNAGNLDYLIDMRASTPVDDAVGWSGFHAIERDLWQNGAITDETKRYSTDLVTHVTQLNDVVATLEYRPEDLANGAADLLEEVQNGKITGEEEEFSHIDLVDFAGNVEGAQQAYAALRPGLEKIDADLVTKIDAEFTSVLETLDGYRDSTAIGGYKTYTAELQASDGALLTAAIQPLHDSLASIAEKVVAAE